jgi:hypothetical protein
MSRRRSAGSRARYMERSTQRTADSVKGRTVLCQQCGDRPVGSNRRSCLAHHPKRGKRGDRPVGCGSRNARRPALNLTCLSRRERRPATISTICGRFSSIILPLMVRFSARRSIFRFLPMGSSCLQSTGNVPGTLGIARCMPPTLTFRQMLVGRSPGGNISSRARV